MPNVSLRGVLQSFLTRLYLSSYGASAHDKILIFMALLSEQVSKVARTDFFVCHASRLWRLSKVRVKSLVFRLIDRVSFNILLPDFEPETQRVIRTHLRSGCVFMDVGAHLGKYTIPAAKAVGSSGKVIALEPHPLNYALLLENIKMNNVEDRVITLNIAAWDKSARLPLYIAHASGQHSLLSGIGPTIFVCCNTLDNIVQEHALERVDLVKIDAEGAEVHILRGARWLLGSLRPDVVVEVRHHNLPAVQRILERHNYIWRSLDEYREHTIILAKAREKGWGRL